MFRALFWVLKVAIFSLIVLALGNWVHWRGKTISDQVKTNLSHAEQITGEAAENAKTWVEEKKREALGDYKKVAKENAPEHIAPSERQKLRALIRELNATQKRD